MAELFRTAGAQSASVLSPRHARIEAIVSTLPGAICELRTRPDGTASFSYASPQIHELFGVTAEELMADGLGAFARVHPDDLAHVRAGLAESASTLAPCCLEYRVLHPQRGDLWIELRGQPVLDSEGSTRWCSVLSDVTARHQAEEELRAAQVRLRAALDASGMGTWAWDPEHDCVELDDVSLALCGRPPGETGRALRTRRLLTFVHPEDASRLRRLVERARAGEGVAPTEVRVRLRGGATRLVSIKGSGVTDASGRLLRMTGVVADVTTQKRLQEAQQRAQKLEALGTLAGGIAHEFNNLLFAMLGNTKLIADELAPNHPAQDGLAEIAHAAQRAAELVRAVQAFSRPRATRRDRMNLRLLVEEVLRLLRVKVPPRIELALRCANDLPPIAADASQIRPIVVHLVDNALHAIGDSRGTIELALEVAEVGTAGSLQVADLTPGRYVVLTVRDSGCGMPPATLERIFDPFFTTKLPGEGTGLGLSVAHGVMRNHAGAITAASEVGRGSVFRLYFPAGVNELPISAVERRITTRLRNERILVVDDEPSLVKLVSQMLVRVGYRVTAHSDPRAALEAFRNRPDDFDAVVTDLTMPVMSGLELVAALRELRPGLPVLMTSGDLGEDTRCRAQEAGIQELIPKPNTVGMLISALDRLFGAG